MRVQVTFDTGHPARVGPVDGAVAVVFQDERPLSGLAARADWRLNGFLSRLVIDGRFAGKAGEWLLVHTQGRLPYTHLFLVGLGKRADRDAKLAKRALLGIAGKLAPAGIHSFVLDLDEVVGAALPGDQAITTFLDALTESYPEDSLSNPPYRPALEVKSRNDARALDVRRRREELHAARARWAKDHDPEAEDWVAASLPIEGRPVAGEVPEAVPDPPPGPESVPEPEAEPTPERTVRVVLLGTPERASALRQAMKRVEGEAFEVEFAR